MNDSKVSSNTRASNIVPFVAKFDQPSGGVKTCFRLSFSGVLEYPGVNSISISSSVHLHRKILRNCKRISMDTSYLIINILLIATFLYKNDSIEL